MARNVLGAEAGIVHDRSHTLDRALASLLASERSRRFLWIALGGYLLLLHLVGLAALTKPNVVKGTLKRLGYAPSSSEFGSAYRQTDDMLRRLDNAARPGGVVFLGDSHLRSLDQGAVAPRPINFAVPGDTTARVLERMKSYRSLASARAVVLQVGRNDLIFRDVAETEKNYAEILRLIPASIPVLATAVLPVLEELADATGRMPRLRC
jgi:hypothetical protein